MSRIKTIATKAISAVLTVAMSLSLASATAFTLVTATPTTVEAATKAIKLSAGYWNSDILIGVGETVKIRTLTTAENKELKKQNPGEKINWKYEVSEPFVSVTPARNNLTADITGLSAGTSVLHIKAYTGEEQVRTTPKTPWENYVDTYHPEDDAYTLACRYINSMYYDYDFNMYRFSETGEVLSDEVYNSLVDFYYNYYLYAGDSDAGNIVYETNVAIKVYPDLSGMTLSDDKISGTIQLSDYCTIMYLDINMPDESYFNYEFPVSVEPDKPGAITLAYRQDRKIAIEGWGSGKGSLTLHVGNKSFTIKYDVKQVGLSDYSMLLVKGKSKTISVLNYDGDVEFESLNPTICSVTKNGKIKAKKNGNAVIKVTMGDDGVTGCVVSVVPAEIKKTVETAIHIGETCTYSQDLRMNDGYYDCSSLTYKAYKSAGINLCGFNGWAPTSRDQAKWCRDHSRMIKKGLDNKNIQKMKYMPGDLMFEYNDKSNYDSIYHVEMISGYQLIGFDEKGKPLLTIDYANRFPGYYWPGGNQFVGRPYLPMK